MITASRARPALTDEAPLSAPRHARWNGFRVLTENAVAARAARGLAKRALTGKRPVANPLVLHGPPGCGKTALVNALVKCLADAPEGRTVRVLAADEDPTDSDLLAVDVLCLEDVHHADQRTALALADLLDRRTARRLPTLVTATAGPAALDVPQRFASRLAAGLVVALEPLSASSRAAIVSDAAKRLRVRLEPDALQRIAHEAPTVRAALGLLQNVSQVAKALPGPVSAAHVEQVLTATGQPTSRETAVGEIVKRVALAFAVSERELLGESRLRGVLRARQVAMYLVRELTGLSLPRIGVAFADRHHTTVLHACQKVEAELEADAALAGRVRELRAGFPAFCSRPL
jgi:chromosomal replication initiator protein